MAEPVVSNRFGPAVETPSGVPQGSVLGPFLFAAFMGSFKFDDVNVHSTKFADDVTIIESVSRNQVSSVTLDNCISVFNQKGLVVNRSKCKQLCVRRSRQCSPELDSGFTNVNSTKILGFILNDHFTWKAQITNVLKLASQRLHIIRSLKNCLTAPELIRVYHSVITSLFMSASPACSQLPTTFLAKMERFQRRGHRLICGPSCDCNGFSCLEKGVRRCGCVTSSSSGNQCNSSFARMRMFLEGFRLPAS